jgi:hypothetical protein
MPRSPIRRSAPSPKRLRGRLAESGRESLEQPPPSRQTTTPGQHLLHHIRRLRSVVGLTSVILLVAESIRLAGGQGLRHFGLVTGATAIILLTVSASYRRIAAYIRAADRREAELTNAARRDGANLAVNTLQHRIGNKLAVTVGYSEMLLDDARLPSDLQAQAQKVLSSAMDAAEVVHKLDSQLTRIEVDHEVAGPEVLDVEASTRIDVPPDSD